VKHRVRIIGGQYRGKKLYIPDVEGLRPTPDRVKETLFNWLMPDIYGARCLDAFAGSGALGFEAYSRGAKQVTLVESSLKAYTNLKQVASSFNSKNIAVVNATAQDYFRHTRECFDIVFLDPPFSKNYLPQCLELLAHGNLLVNGGLVYLESAEKQAVDSSYWQEKKSKQAGQVIFSLYKKIALVP
jgi:16S rRNA (guanine966-N2)-methyltransferase